jgi:CRISPR/Cas system CSM-associated protein Csm2 small subunit
MITYLAKEKERDIKRKEHYLKVKCEVLDKLLYEEDGDDFEKEMLGASAS